MSARCRALVVIMFRYVSDFLRHLLSSVWHKYFFFTVFVCLSILLTFYHIYEIGIQERIQLVGARTSEEMADCSNKLTNSNPTNKFIYSYCLSSIIYLLKKGLASTGGPISPNACATIAPTTT